MLKLFFPSCLLILSGGFFFPLSSAVFCTIDTTTPLSCIFSSKYQNRVMVENGRIQKVIAADEDRLSIFMEEISGQAFICARDYNPAATTISIVTETGIVQDLYITFSERLPEVVILKDSMFDEKQEKKQEQIQERVAENHASVRVEDLLHGHIPEGYIPCPIKRGQWKPKKGIVLETIAQLEGPNEILRVYLASNNLCKRNSLTECELQQPGCRWIFLETTSLLPKQKILCLIAVEK